MRWVAAFALFAAAACAPLLPATPSSAPPTASAVVRATPRPTLTERPAATATPVRTARATATPVPANATPRPTPIAPTPRPTLGQPVVNADCAAWPEDPAIATLMTHLALPPSMCLLRTTTATVGRLVCTVVGCVPVTAGCAEVGSCVEVVAGENPHYVLVYVHAPTTLPAPIGEGYAITRHLCKLHQERTLIDAVLRGRSWLGTIEGGEFQNAFTFFRSAYATEAVAWGIEPSDVENYADVCAAWYYPSARDQRVGAYQPLLQFAQKWLPQ